MECSLAESRYVQSGRLNGSQPCSQGIVPQAAKEAIKLFDSYDIVEGEVVGLKQAA